MICWRKEGFCAAIANNFSFLWDSASATLMVSRSYLLKGIAILFCCRHVSAPDVLFFLFLSFIGATLTAHFASFPFMLCRRCWATKAWFEWCENCVTFYAFCRMIPMIECLENKNLCTFFLTSPAPVLAMSVKLLQEHLLSQKLIAKTLLLLLGRGDRGYRGDRLPQLLLLLVLLLLLLLLLLLVLLLLLLLLLSRGDRGYRGDRGDSGYRGYRGD